MNENTLMGRKLDLYVLMKIVKYCTGSSAKSYQCKFAANQVLTGRKDVSMKELGAAIKETIHHSTIRGKFCSVHPDLESEGIIRVELEEEGLHFITKTKTGEMQNVK